jgi:hypothetical protein
LTPKELFLAIIPLISRERSKNGVREVEGTCGKGGQNKGQSYGRHGARVGEPYPPKATLLLGPPQKGG